MAIGPKDSIVKEPAPTELKPNPLRQTLIGDLFYRLIHIKILWITLGVLFLLSTCSNKTMRIDLEVPLNTGEVIKARQTLKYGWYWWDSIIPKRIPLLDGRTLSFTYRGKLYEYKPGPTNEDMTPAVLAISPEGYPVLVFPLRGEGWQPGYSRSRDKGCYRPFFGQQTALVPGDAWVRKVPIDAWLYYQKANLLMFQPKFSWPFVTSLSHSDVVVGNADSINDGRRIVDPTYIYSGCRNPNFK